MEDPAIEGDIGANISRLRGDIAISARKSGRASEKVKLVIVTKTRPVSAIKQVIAAGATDIGENRVQELKEKQDIVTEPVNWHMIGHLQRNKVKQVVGAVDLIHSVDTLELAGEIDRQASKIGIKQKVLVQVNVAREHTKYGISLDNLEKLVAEMDKLRHIDTKGLMTMAPMVVDSESVRPIFAELYACYEELKASWPWDILSMGMSNDFRIAIEEGSSLVRIGRAVFSAAS